MLKKISVVLIVCFLVITIPGCGNSKFEAAYSEFKLSFVTATDFLDNTVNESDTDILRAADMKILKNEHKIMNDVISEMNASAKSVIEKRELEMANADMGHIEFFIDAGARVETLNDHEIIRLAAAITSAEVDRDFYKGKTK